MDIVLVTLNSNKDFTRTVKPLSDPLVVHAVAGAGKSTLLKSWVLRSSKICVHSLGVFDLGIQGRTEAELKVLDEYQLASSVEGFQVLVGDPLQGDSHLILEPHFVSLRSYRFGSTTCALLQSVGIEAYSSRFDEVRLENIWSAVTPFPEPIIAIGEEVHQLLTQQGLKPKRVCEVQGGTYDSVTVVVDRKLRDIPKHTLYVALTRHRYLLRVLSPNVTASKAIRL
ncbi:MAG: triple gene block protein 1 [Physalis virus X]|nr:MAG: triple gene block protein 1 [Physalis virus X]UEP18566.1 MAG: triple gene block protein 1 [Physalis virus X]